MAAVQAVKPLDGVAAAAEPVKIDGPKLDVVPGVIDQNGSSAGKPAPDASPANNATSNGPPRNNGNMSPHPNGGAGGGKQWRKNNQGGGNRGGNNDAGGRTPQQPASDGKKSDKPQQAGPGQARSADKPDDEKKFSTRSRLFVGNLSSDTTEQDIRKMFEKYNQASAPDVFLDKQKMFAFVRVDTRINAEKAKGAIDGTSFKGRLLRVRFASSSSGIKVKNLGPNVCNELLHRAFERFGEIDKAVISVDEKGRPCGEGIVYFSRKQSAMQAIHRVNTDIYLLGASPRPVVCEMLEEKDIDDGMSEVHIANRQPYQNEISEPPHFAVKGSLEYEFGQRWKKHLTDHQNQLQQLERIFHSQTEDLEKEMEKSIDDFEINKIKQTIAQETMKMRQLEERKAQRRPGAPGNPPQQQQQQQQNMQQGMQQQNMQQQGMQQQNMQQQGMQQFPLQQQVAHHQQQNLQQPGMRQGVLLPPQLQGLPPAPPGFGLPVGMGQGFRIQGPGGPQLMEPFGAMGAQQPSMLGLPNANFLPGGHMGPGLLPQQRLPLQFGGGGGGAPFEQQHFDPNLAGLGQRQPDYDFKRGGGGLDSRGGDPKRLRN